MATIRHSISIDASPDRIFPLVSSGHGFSQWWAADVSDDIPRNIVSLGFFNRATVYDLRPVRIIPPTVAEWACQSGEEWNGTVLLFDLLPQKKPARCCGFLTWIGVPRRITLLLARLPGEN